MNYKGKLKGFPMEVVEKMQDYQVLQGNPRDIRVFEENIYADEYDGGFWWLDTIEGKDFWRVVILNRDFDLFFEKYPKESVFSDKKGLPDFKFTPPPPSTQSKKEDNNGWISVEDDKPDDGKECLVAIDGVGHWCDFACYEKSEGKWYNSDSYRIRPTHWQPLPQPPKKKEE